MATRILCALALIVTLAACGGGGSSTPEAHTAAPAAAQAHAVVAITVDVHDPSTAARIMRSHGLVGTYYADPDDPRVEASAMRDLQAAGWSVGVYLRENLVDALSKQGPESVHYWLAHVKDGLSALGVTPTTIAPTQRAWSASLTPYAAEHGFATIRAPRATAQAYPWPDPWIAGGGSPSLNATDTPESLRAELARLLERGGAWVIVVHGVGEGDPVYSVSEAAFEALCSAVEREASAGKLRVVTL